MIRVERRGAVALITLDRQERRNAIDQHACRALADAVGGTEDARVLVLTGAGGHFCAGADLTHVEDAAFVEALRAALLALRDVPKPVIAAVQGAALGAGTQLAIACDLRVAAPDARFGIPAAKLGLMVDHWTVQRLALLAGHGPARSMLLAAAEVDGASASGFGLVQRVGTLADALAWADEIAANVWQVPVEVGQAVATGDTIAILESMKMEIPVESPVAGKVAELRVAPDDQVNEGDVIAVIDES